MDEVAVWAARHPGALIRGYRGISPRVAADAFVAPGAVIIGDVEIGAGVNIWYGCVLRGDDHRITIGAGTNVQDGTVIHVTLHDHPTVIGAGVVIGHGARIHGCTLGDGCLVGIGAIVLDGAVVEAGALVAAGALVPPRKRVPGGELWAGNPARKLRDLTDADKEYIPWDARHYVGLGREHAGIWTS